MPRLICNVDDDDDDCDYDEDDDDFPKNGEEPLGSKRHGIY
jgi:hypothetical protein